MNRRQFTRLCISGAGLLMLLALIPPSSSHAQEGHIPRLQTCGFGNPPPECGPMPQPQPDYGSCLQLPRDLVPSCIDQHNRESQQQLHDWFDCVWRVCGTIDATRMARTEQVMRETYNVPFGTWEGPTQEQEYQTYVVVPGDTCWSIAGHFGLTVEEFIAMNGLSPDDCQMLFPGMLLVVSFPLAEGTATGTLRPQTGTAEPSEPSTPTDTPTTTPVPVPAVRGEALVADLQGEVFYTREGQTVPLGAGDVGFLLREGDVIRTGEGATTLLVDEWSNEYDIGAGTTIRLTTLTTEEILIALERGRVRTNAQPCPAGKECLRVCTPLACAGVRGTEFEVQTTDTQTTVRVSDGQVLVYDLAGNGLAVLAAGQMCEVGPMGLTGAVHSIRNVRDLPVAGVIMIAGGIICVLLGAGWSVQSRLPRKPLPSAVPAASLIPATDRPPAIAPERRGSGEEIGINQAPPLTGDAYVDDCFRMEFEETREDRRWQSLGEMADIPRLALGGQYERALAAIDQALPRYPDLDFLHVWRGHILGKTRGPEEARRALLEGIERARSKIDLCDVLAQLEFDASDLKAAVCWWIRSCVLQIPSRLVEAHPFMLLAYIADDLDLKKYARLLFEQTDRIRNIRLNAQGEASCARLAQSQGNESIKRAIRVFCDFYILHAMPSARN